MTKRISALLLFFICQLVAAQEMDLFGKIGHESPIKKMAISPDGKYFVSVETKHLAIIWDISTGQQLRVIKDVLDATFSKDDNTIYLAMTNQTIRLVDLSANIIKQFPIRSFGGADMRSTAFYPEAGIILVGGQVFDINKGFLKRMSGHSAMGQDYSPVTQRVAMAAEDSAAIIISDALTGLTIKTIRVSLITEQNKYVEFSKDGSRLLAGDGASVVLIDLASGKTTTLLQKEGLGFAKATFTPDNKSVAMMSSQTVSLVDIQTGKKRWTQKHNIQYGFNMIEYQMKFSLQGNKLLFGTQSRLTLANTGTGTSVKEFAYTRRNSLRRIYFTNDNSRIIAQSGSERILIWNIQTGMLEKSITTKISDQKYMPSKDGKTFFLTGDEHLKEIDTSGKVIFQYVSPNKLTGGYRLELSYTGQYVMNRSFSATAICGNKSTDAVEIFDKHAHKSIFYKSCGATVGFANTQNIVAIKEVWPGNNIGFYEIPSGKLLYEINVPGIGGGNLDLIFSPNDQYLTIKSAKTGVILVDLKAKQSLMITDPILDKIKTIDKYALIDPKGFTPDEKYLIVYSYSTAHILFYNIAEKKFDEKLMIEKPEGGISELSISKTVPVLFMSSYSGSIKVWDIAQNKKLATLYPDDSNLNWAVVAPDGRFDANEGAQANMYHVTGSSVVPLHAMYERFFTPRLLPRILAGEKFDPSPVNVNKLKKAPTVTIEFKDNNRGLTVEDDEVQTISTKESSAFVTLKANCPLDAVTEIRLYQNGKLVETTRGLLVVDDTKGEKSVSKTFQINLLNGTNRFRAIAFNTERTESRPVDINVIYTSVNPVPIVSNTVSGTQLHLVVVGINVYKNTRYNLNYAQADAEAFKRAIENGAGGIFSKVITHYIKDAEASKSGIEAALEKVKIAANPEDLFVFYFAGHGVVNDKKEFFLVPSDVTQLYGSDDALAQKGLSAASLQLFSKDIKAQKQLYILDACQSAGALGNIVASRGAAEEKAIAQLARSTGTHWLTASGSNQFASEFTQLGHGSFTYCLLEAFKGEADTGDKRITVKELDAYLQSKVPEVTQKYKGTAQYPASFGYGNDFPIIIIK